MDNPYEDILRSEDQAPVKRRRVDDNSILAIATTVTEPAASAECKEDKAPPKLATGEVNITDAIGILKKHMVNEK
jgi:hypothetical protein